ncbi:MAG: biotin/lipoyl-binding protein, partial [Pedobacter sp.]
MKTYHSYSQSFNSVKSYNTVMGLLSLVAMLSLSACSDSSKLQVTAPIIKTLPVAAVNNSSETTYIDYPASIEGAVDLEIRPQVSGSLDRIYVNEGAQVTRGQILFKINEQPFKEALNNAKASLNAAKAAQLNAQLEVDKLTPLVANKVVSDYQL